MEWGEDYLEYYSPFFFKKDQMTLSALFRQDKSALWSVNFVRMYAFKRLTLVTSFPSFYV